MAEEFGFHDRAAVAWGLAALVGAGLTAVSIASFRSAEHLRMLQRQLDAAANEARYRLAEGGPSFFTRGVPGTQVTELSAQNDPMGLTVRALRVYVLVDVAITGAAVSGAVATSPSSDPRVGVIVLAAGVAALWLARVWLKAFNSRIERSTEEMLETGLSHLSS